MTGELAVIAWVLTVVLVVSVTLIAVGWALRPYVLALRNERDHWMARALDAEGRQLHDGIEDVRLIDPATGSPWGAESERADIETWLKGDL